MENKILDRLEAEGKKVLLLQGTDPVAKLHYAVGVFGSIAGSSTGNSLVIGQSFDCSKSLAGYTELTRKLLSQLRPDNRLLRLGRSTVRFETFDSLRPHGQKLFECSLVWPGELLSSKRETADWLETTTKTALLVPTVTDNKDLSWLYPRAKRITLHSKDPRFHAKALAIQGHLQEGDYD